MVTLSVDATAASTSTSAATVFTSVAAASTSKLGFLPDSDVRAAEATWAIHVISTKASFRAREGISKIFKMMFTDSHIVSEKQLSRTKTAYLGLAPYFHRKLTNYLRFAMHIVMCFDKSLNRISKLLHMDLAVRFWDENKNEISSRSLA
ncbi:hypothetical protein PR048_027049 [Dryococelus australis]|uniref:Uncharacterized protein n=1 Tax=Dryococelus australis TaxID=614101 RepID=A0ABQ9GED0_9NEOP|nr:hypothetical protein PR048_027049 [Dryococelus australis]